MDEKKVNIIQRARARGGTSMQLKDLKACLSRGEIFVFHQFILLVTIGSEK